MKIGFCGTMSVGKSTLVNALKELPEFKDYFFATERSKYLRDLGIPLNTDSTLKGQTIFLAERCSELLYENLITDRTIIDVIAFTQCAGSISSSEKFSFIDYASNFIGEYDYIFYISPEGMGIEDNLVRETNPQYRNFIDITIDFYLKRFESKIKNLYHIKNMSVTERVEFIKDTIFINKKP